MNLKKALSTLLAFVLVFSLTACSATEVSPSSESSVQSSSVSSEVEDDLLEPQEFAALTDQAGREVIVTSSERIVSGYYISTSALIALGLSDRLVGIEAKADKRPIYALTAPQLLTLPNVGTAKEFDMEGCLALDPDLVILPKRLLDEAATLEGFGIAVLLVNPESPADLAEMFSLLGTATGTEADAEKITTYYDTALSALTTLATTATTTPKVFIGSNSSFLATAPADMYQASLIRLAGGENVGDVLENDSWTEVSYEQFLEFNPDVIVIPSEANYSKDDILADAQLAEITAVKNGAIYTMPSAFEAWDSPTTSWIMGLRWMISALHPELYPLTELQQDAADFYKEIYGVDSIDTGLVGQ